MMVGINSVYMCDLIEATEEQKLWHTSTIDAQLIDNLLS